MAGGIAVPIRSTVPYLKTSTPMPVDVVACMTAVPVRSSNLAEAPLWDPPHATQIVRVQPSDRASDSNGLGLGAISDSRFSPAPHDPVVA